MDGSHFLLSCHSHYSSSIVSSKRLAGKILGLIDCQWNIQFHPSLTFRTTTLAQLPLSQLSVALDMVFASLDAKEHYFIVYSH